MKTGSWFFMIFHGSERVRTVRVEKRTFFILGILGILFLTAFAVFAYGFFSFWGDRNRWRAEGQELKGQIFVLEQQVKKGYLDNLPPKPNNPPVAVQEMKVLRRAQGKGISVSFRLVNQFSQDYPVTGTIAMVAKNDAEQPPVYRVIPEMELQKGIPLRPEKGKGFEVKRHKFVEGYFPDSGSGESLKKLTIYVYSQNGKLILEYTADIPETVSKD
jgi:hypothetical protein